MYVRSAVKRKEPSVSGLEIYTSVIEERIFVLLILKRTISRFVSFAVVEFCGVSSFWELPPLLVSSFLEMSFSFSII